MKKLFALLWLFFVCVPIVNAGNVEKGSDGSFRFRDDMTYTPLDITVTPEAFHYKEEVKEALVKPGVVIPVVEVEVRRDGMTDLFHEKRTTVVKVGVIFEKDAKLVNVVKNVEIGVKKFNPYFILWMAGVIAIMVANIFGNILFATSSASATATLAAFAAASFTVPFAFPFAFAAVLAAASTFITINKKVIFWRSIFYLVLMALSAFFMYRFIL